MWIKSILNSLFSLEKTVNKYKGRPNSEEDKQIVGRARRIQRFLSQPMFVAEQFTGIEGKFVSIKDSLEAFKTILSGELDAVPEQAFYMTGGLDEVMAKAKDLEENL